MSEGFSTERAAGVLRTTCLTCKAVNANPDKGIGRANRAAWMTRHQHEPDPETVDHLGPWLEGRS